jgi:hypothetical protein
MCSFLLFLLIDRRPRAWTVNEHPGAQTIGCVPIASARPKRDLALSVHFRLQTTMLPNNLILDSWNA